MKPALAEAGLKTGLVASGGFAALFLNSLIEHGLHGWAYLLVYGIGLAVSLYVYKESSLKLPDLWNFALIEWAKKNIPRLPQMPVKEPASTLFTLDD